MDVAPEQKRVMEALAQARPHPVTLRELIKRVGLGEDAVRSALNDLKQRGWVVSTGGLHITLDDSCLAIGEGIAYIRVIGERSADQSAGRAPSSHK